jgi:hypothetical protein
VRPRGWTIFGGTHVASQAERVFRLYPDVDVVVNGEGEIPFANLLRAYLEGRSRHDLGDIRGISFRSTAGAVVTTAPEPRIKDLDTIPSPFLTGALPMFDDEGELLYDAVTMETNRGCPYQCAFCYWGGAIGQKLHSFSSARLREELELFGRMRVENVCLCDANFGMLPADQQFLEDFLATRARHQYPRALTTSWAKNKGKLFYEIVRTMREAGLHADFTLAIQTLDPVALRTSRRQNMAINKFEDLCEWLHKERLGAYAEMIWGLPGETYESFLSGYDRIARFVPRIATYSNLLLPNTAYDKEREEHGFVTIRGRDYDFEYILEHATMSLRDNRRMHAFMFWARVVAEYMFLRYVFIPLRERCGLSQSTLLLDLDAWISTQGSDPAAAALISCRDEVVSNLDASRMGRPIRVLYQHPGAPSLLERWWAESILPKAAPELRPFLQELLRYEALMRPIHEEVARAEGLEVEVLDGIPYFVRRGVTLAFDVAAAISPGADTTVPPSPASQPATDYFYQVGFGQHIDNHEIIVHYRAKTREEVHAESLLRDRAFVPERRDRHVVGLPDASRRKLLAEVGE